MSKIQTRNKFATEITPTLLGAASIGDEGVQLLSLQSTVYGVVILLSLIGNVAVLFVVARNKRMHTPTNYFIVNLAISDIMVTSSCTWVHLVDNLTEGWVLGAFFCKINSFAQGTLRPYQLHSEASIGYYIQPYQLLLNMVLSSVLYRLGQKITLKKQTFNN